MPILIFSISVQRYSRLLVIWKLLATNFQIWFNYQDNSIFGFITRITVSNITNEALADIKKSISGHGTFRRNTLEVFSTIDEIIDNTDQLNKKGHNYDNKSNNSFQQPAPTFHETDINTLCSCQQFAPEITADTTSLNTSIEISLTVPTDIQTPIPANNLNDTSNFTQKSIVKIEVQLLVLKSYVDWQLSRLTSKISDSLKKALANLLQQNIAFLENELKSKNRIIQSLLEAQNVLPNSLSS